MLYTTYLYKLNTLSRDTIKLLIMRFQPKININNYNINKSYITIAKVS